MPGTLSPIDAAKFAAAKRACDFVETGMRVGLGTGSTAAWLLRCLGEAIKRDGLRITGVPTSRRTADMAREMGIEITSLDEARWLDLTIDGADEIDRDLNLIKGGGGAHLREKIVATASDRLVIIADSSKRVETLGAFPLPVEVVPFGMGTTRLLIEETIAALDVMGDTVALRMDGDAPFRTDEGNHILDLGLERIGNARKLALALNQIPGVVETGLFIDTCDIAITSDAQGRCRVQDSNGTVYEDDVETGEAQNIFADLGK